MLSSLVLPLPLLQPSRKLTASPYLGAFSVILKPLIASHVATMDAALASLTESTIAVETCRVRALATVTDAAQVASCHERAVKSVAAACLLRVCKLADLCVESAEVAADQLLFAMRSLSMSTASSSLHASALSSAALLLPLITQQGRASHTVPHTRVMSDLASLSPTLRSHWAVYDHPIGCRALGTLVNTITVISGDAIGLAVSANERWLVVGRCDDRTLSLHSLPEGELVRMIGEDTYLGRAWAVQSGINRLCFTSNSNLLVVEARSCQLSEVQLDGELVRVVGQSELQGAQPFSVAASERLMAVGYSRGHSKHVVLFDCVTGTRFSGFFVSRTEPGQCFDHCPSVRFTHDGCLVIVAEMRARRVSLFTTLGECVGHACTGTLGCGLMDLALTDAGEYIVADVNNSRICVFSRCGSALVRSWSASGQLTEADAGPATPWSPVALAVAGSHLYVLDLRAGCVRVFK